MNRQEGKYANTAALMDEILLLLIGTIIELIARHKAAYGQEGR